MIYIMVVPIAIGVFTAIVYFGIGIVILFTEFFLDLVGLRPKNWWE